MMCRFFSNFRWIKPSRRGKKRKIARDLYEKKRIYIWSIRLLCVLSQCQRDNQRDFQSEIPTLTFHFEIVFSSLYKFCEGMFRRETVHSHFFAPNSEVYDVPITSGQQANEKEHIWFLPLKDGTAPERTKWDVFSHKRLKKLHWTTSVTFF